MNEMQIFDYNGKTVRTIEIGDEPWFVLKDVCDILGITNQRHVTERLDEDEVRQTYLIDSLGRQQNTAIVSEPGLYNVILRSDKPEAKPFRKHVTSVILPTIRRTGGYVANEDVFAETYLNGLPEEYKNLFKLNLKTIGYLNGQVKELNEQVDGLNESVKCLTAESAAKDKVIEQKDTIIEEAKPKVEFYDIVADTKELADMAQFTKTIYEKSGVRMGRNRLYKWLRSEGYLRDNNEPYQQYVTAGYFVLKMIWVNIGGTPEPKPKTFLTGKGQQFILKKLKEALEMDLL